MVDIVIVGLTIAAAVWGYRQGLSAPTLALIGFGVGAIIGSRVAPLFLDGGLEDPFAPVVALPAALIFGGIIAAVFERIAFVLSRRIRLGGKANAVVGAVLAACVGLVAAWVLGAVVARVDEVRANVRDSEIIGQLNALLPPPGPLLRPKQERQLDPLPQLTGPAPNLGPADPAITRDPQIRAAAASVVKIYVKGCKGGGAGSGWIARDGIVVTNAHVVEGSEELALQPRGRGGSSPGEVIWFDQRNDIALIRAPGLSGEPVLALGLEPEGGTSAAALGFPGGGPYKAAGARTGAPTRDPGLRVGGKRIKVRITPFRSIGPRRGSSGGPLVDAEGRVRTMVFAGRDGTSVAYGVPMRGIRRALRRAGSPVEHGSC